MLSYKQLLRGGMRGLMAALGDLNPPNPLGKGAKSRIPGFKVPLPKGDLGGFHQCRCSQKMYAWFDGSVGRSESPNPLGKGAKKQSGFFTRSID
jgi:hypothetical protein